uniref:ORF2 n=1 Tax=Fusarium graminearum dsRNA mycovirus 1 TaxID=194397 RepID=A0A7D4YAW2_9VIRU|nr:ORF2 [Fusarium graminearum dsRNA mycovirus-1]
MDTKDILSRAQEVHTNSGTSLFIADFNLKDLQALLGNTPRGADGESSAACLPETISNVSLGRQQHAIASSAVGKYTGVSEPDLTSRLARLPEWFLPRIAPAVSSGSKALLEASRASFREDRERAKAADDCEPLLGDIQRVLSFLSYLWKRALHP